MGRSPGGDKTLSPSRWKTIHRPFSYAPTGLIIVILGLWIWGFHHEELLRQFNVLYHRSSYRRETLTVVGTGEWDFRKHRIPTVIGRIGEQQIEVNAYALGYDPPWAFFRSSEQRETLRTAAFPIGSQLEILRSPEAHSSFAHADPEIVSERIYGPLTWTGFLRTALLWHAVLLVGVGLMVYKYQYWWYIVSSRWRLNADIARIETQVRQSGRRKRRKR